MPSRMQHKVWIYVDRVYHFYRLPGNSIVLDILKHHKLEEKVKKLNEELKDLKKESKDLKEKLKNLEEKLDPGDPNIAATNQRIVSCDQRIVACRQEIVACNQDTTNVDSSKYEFSSCSWKDIISIDTQCSDLFDKGVGKDIKSAIHIIEKVPPPAAKRPKIFDPTSLKPPANSRCPSDLNITDINKLKEAPPYYHWMALCLRDMFRSSSLDNKVTLDDVAVEVPTQTLDRVCEQFSLLTSKHFENEHDLTAQVNRYLDRFYFDDNHVTEGAVLAQYPLKSTQRGDSCIVLYGNNWTIKHPVVATNDSKLKVEEFHKAEDESRLLTLSALSRSTSKFPFVFSFPLGVNKVKLEIHITVNNQLQYIDICTAPFSDYAKLKSFFILTYAVVRWSCQNDLSRHSDVPMCVRPTKELVLASKFGDRDVFLENSRVYKFYLTDSPKKPNVAVMESLGMKDVKLEEISNEYSLLSYPYIAGGEDPVYIEQFEVIADQLLIIHSKGLVHGDVRGGNLIFGTKQDEAHLIDFDYVAEQGTDYPNNYNHTLPERHQNLKKMEYEHDWYSLIYLMAYHFSGTVATANITNDELKKYRDKYLNGQL